MQSLTTYSNVATDKSVAKPVAQAYRALWSAEAAMHRLSGGESGRTFNPAERQAFESIVGAMDRLHGGPTWTPFTAG